MLCVLGNQDPINEKNVEEGPILSVIDDLRAKREAVDMVALIAVNSDGGMNTRANETREERLRDTSVRLQVDKKIERVIVRNLDANPALLSEMEDLLEKEIKGMIAETPWDETLVFVSSGSFAIQTALYDLAQWSVVPQPKLLQRVYGHGAEFFEPRRRPQEAAFDRFTRAMTQASFGSAVASADELKRLTSGDAHTFAEGILMWALSFTFLDEGDLAHAVEAVNGIPGLLRQDLNRHSGAVQEIYETAANETIPAWQRAAAAFFLTWSSVSWRATSGQTASVITRSRATMEQLARIEAHFTLEKDASLAEYKVHKTSVVPMNEDDRCMDVDRSTGGTLRLWLAALNRQGLAPEAEGNGSIWGIDFRVESPSITWMDGKHKSMFYALNNSFEIHAGKPWTEEQFKELDQFLRNRIKSALDVSIECSDLPLGIHSILSDMESIRTRWREVSGSEVLR